MQYPIQITLINILAGLSFITPVFAQASLQPFVVKGDSLTYDIGRYVQTLYDTKGTLKIEDILLPIQQAKFKNENNLKKEVKQHWYRLEIDNQTNKTQFYLDTYNNLHSELYLIQDGKIIRSANGAYIPQKERAYLGSLSKHPLQLKKGKTTLYLAYCYLNTCSECLGKKHFWLHDINQTYKTHINIISINFATLGILVVLGAYNLFIFFLVKDKSYLYYVLSIATLASYVFFNDIFMYAWFRPDGILSFWLSRIITNISSGISLLFFIRFSQIYLDTLLDYPKWHKRLNIGAMVLILSKIIVLSSMLLGGYNYVIETVIHTIDNSIIGILALVLILLSIQAWHRKTLTGKYYAYANAIFLVSVMVYAGGLTAYSLYYHTFLTYNSLKIGVVFQMTTFAIALASRINLLKEEIARKKFENERLEKEQAIEIQHLTAKKNIELEQKVKERTRELQQSNAEIKTQNEEIRAQAEVLQIQKKDIEEKSRLLAEAKDRQLMNATLQVVQKNELLPEIAKFIEQIRPTLPEDTKKDAKDILKQIAQNTNIDEQWENLKMHFEQVHPTLFANLLARCPELTNYDLRLCAYEKMGLSRKEVGLLLNANADSIRKQQYRIKQKLGLNEETSFADFIMNMR